MITKRTLVLLTMIAACTTGIQAQGWVGKLKNKAIETAKKSIENKVEQKVERTTEKAADRILDGKKTAQGKEVQSNEAKPAQEVPAEGKAAEAEYQQNDFVPGSVAFFEDNLQNEQMGEFPSKWDLIEGNADVANMKGQKCIHLHPGTIIEPLMTNQDSYLPDVFTAEFDFWMNDPATDLDTYYYLNFMDSKKEKCYEIYFGEGYKQLEVEVNYKPANSNEGRDAGHDVRYNFKKNDYNHMAISFNKRALKVYVNGQRVINIPNCRSAVKFNVIGRNWGGYNGDKAYLTNFRLAKGAVDLYERNTTDMSAVEKAIAETGKFVTNNILFETAKATLKPESMEEIQKVADYMKKNPTARFEVQGHTDNQGSDKINDPLSQQRAEAVIKALEGLGVDGFNLRAVGKGSHMPVADNATDEGRAKNRRVEFIKK